jgi:branched-chain amino acid transport system permease protein
MITSIRSSRWFGKVGQKLPIVLLFIALALIAPGLSRGTQDTYLLALIYALVAVSWNFLFNSLGVFSLGHVVFFAAGGYTTAIFVSKLDISPWLSLVAGSVVAALISLPIGLAALRRRTSRMYVALLTLIVAQVSVSLVGVIGFLGGSTGIYLEVAPEASLGSMQFDTAMPFIYMLLVLNLAAILFFGILANSRFGYRLRSIRDDEVAAEACGIAVAPYKIAAFAISAAAVAPAGTIFAQYQLLATPESLLSINLLVGFVIAGLVGGATRSWGAVVGAFIIVPLSQEAGKVFGDKPGVSTLVFALVLFVIALVIPQGISGTWDSFSKKRAARRRSILKSQETPVGDQGVELG